MPVLRGRLPVVAAVLLVVLLGSYASSVTAVAAGIRDGTTEKMINDATRAEETPATGFYTFALAFLSGYFVADIINHFFGFAPADTSFPDVTDDLFDF